MGVISDEHGETYDDRSALMESFIDEVEAALSGLEIPSLGVGADACIEFNFGNSIEEGDDKGGTEFRAGINHGRDNDPDGMSDFEKKWLEGLYNMTLDTIDAIPTGPSQPILDPTAPAPSFPVEMESCTEFLDLVSCIPEDMASILAGDMPECACEYLITPTESMYTDAGIDSADSDAEEQFCEYALSLLLDIWVPSLPSFDIPFPPDIDFSFDFDIDLDLVLNLPTLALELITIVFDFIMSLPTIAIGTILPCFLEGGFDPCESLGCINDALSEAFDEGLAEAGIDMSQYTAWLAAFSVYLKRITGHMLAAVIGLVFGWGALGNCICSELGII